MYTVEKDGIVWRVVSARDREQCATCLRESDATRIARALNRDAAMGEVRDFVVAVWIAHGGTALGDSARQSLAALDAVEVAP